MANPSVDQATNRAPSILDRFLITDRVALITGAGRGIGAAIAVAYAEAGADVAISARTEAQLDEIAARVESVGRRALVLPADVNDLDAVGELVSATVAKFGRLDIVVNNAGGSPPKAFLDTSARSFERAIHFNVTTAFELTKVATPHLLSSGAGAVVNISSAAGRFASRGFAAYGTAKAALAHLTRELACDLAPRVRVNAIAVGSVATSALEFVLTSDDIRTAMESSTPLRRLGDPQDIAAAALWLVSPAGAYVTGKVIEVDGGLQTSNLEMPLPDL
ncbi:MAG: SDR family oxidoreductase [Acidimicrobiales bacterium]